MGNCISAQDKDGLEKVVRVRPELFVGVNSNSSSRSSTCSSSPFTRDRCTLSPGGFVHVPLDLKEYVKPENAHKDIRVIFHKYAKIGYGITSSIYSGSFEKKKVAIKQMRHDNHWGDVIFAAEIAALTALKHPGIVRCIATFRDRTSNYLITELAECDLHSVIARKKLKEDVCRDLAKQMLQSIKCVHDAGIAHRDLKPENIVLFKEKKKWVAKLCDFGECAYVEDEKVYDDMVGSPQYMSPERFSRAYQGWTLKPSDMWAFGVIIYECLTSQRCFIGQSVEEILENVLELNWAWPKDASVSLGAVHFVESLLKPSPQDRMTVDEALRHPFISPVT